MPVPCARLVRSVVVLRPLRGEGRDVGGRIDQRAHSCGGCGNGLLRHGAVLAGLRRAGSSKGASPPRKRASALRAVRPPSTRSSVPLTYDASSEARKATAAATSSGRPWRSARSEEHTSELQSLMRISYAVLCLKKTTKNKRQNKKVRE